MKTLFIKFLILVVAVALPGQTTAQSQLKSFTLKVAGSSTLHEWESGVEKIEWKGQLVQDDKKNFSIQGIEVKIPVTSIKSQHGKLMDGKTYEAFNSEKNPYILFKPRSLTQKLVNGEGLLTIEGDLTMNGVANAIVLSIAVKNLPNGEMRFSGTRTLKMSDYKMKQPTAMMGTVKVGDEVTVKFDLTLAKNTSNPL